MDGGNGTCGRKSEGRELETPTSISVELLCHGESEDCHRGRDCKNADSFLEAVRLDIAWLSLAETRIDGGVSIITVLGNEVVTRLDAALSSLWS